MEGFDKKQLEQLRELFTESEKRSQEEILGYIDERFVAERQYTRSSIVDSEDRLSLEIRDANHQRKEDVDIALERVSAIETRVDALELTTQEK